MELDDTYRWYSIVLKDENLKPCTYYFRGVSVKELRLAGIKPDKFAAETYILTQAVLPKKDWNTMLAGVCNRLLREIYRVSGLDEDGITFTEAVAWIQSENGALEAAAVSMIPGCTLEALERCDPFIYAKYLVMGKFQFETMYGIPVEQAFLPAEKRPKTSNGIDPNPKPGPAVLPGPGEIGHQVENQFHWERK